MSARSVRLLFEAALFLVALGLGAAAFDLVNDTVADALYFGAWCAAMLLIFSLALRLPLHLRGRLARLANPGIVGAALGLALLANIALYRHDAHFDATVSGRFTPPPELETIARSLLDDVVLTYFYNSKDDYAYGAKQVLEVVARRHPYSPCTCSTSTRNSSRRAITASSSTTPSLSRRRAAALRSRTRWICARWPTLSSASCSGASRRFALSPGMANFTQQATCISVMWRPWVLACRAPRTYWKRHQTRSIGSSWQSRRSATMIARSRRRCSRRSLRIARSLPTSGPPAPMHPLKSRC